MKVPSHLCVIKSIEKLGDSEALACFRLLDPSSALDKKGIRQAVGKMFRGAMLLKHALEWSSPSVGGGGKLDSIRGMQWRLVMAYGGYEQIENAIFGEKCHSKTPRKNTLSRIQLKHRLPGPVLTQRTLDRIEERDQEAADLCEFLGIQKNKRDRFSDWLLGRAADEPCGTERAVFISAQLRHLVAHGALSAVRTKRLGLETAFEAAPLLLHEVAGRLLNTMEYTPDRSAEVRKREELLALAQNELGPLAEHSEMLVQQFVRLSPPQDPPIFSPVSVQSVKMHETHLAQFVVANRGGLAGGLSRKPGNILLNWRRLFLDSPDLILTGAGAIATPWLVPLAALSIFIKVWTQSTLLLTKEHAASLCAMWHRCENMKIHFDSALICTNELFQVYSWPPLEVVTFQSVLKELETIRCIEIRSNKEIWLCEEVRGSYW